MDDPVDSVGHHNLLEVLEVQDVGEDEGAGLDLGAVRTHDVGENDAILAEPAAQELGQAGAELAQTA